MSPEDPQPRPGDGVADAWTVSLDAASPAPGGAGDVIFQTGPRVRRRRVGVAVLAGVAVLFGLVWLLYDGPGGVLVTVPAQILRPSGVRADLPDGPARWLIEAVWPDDVAPDGRVPRDLVRATGRCSRG